jgi:hypothetical protein
VLELGRPGVLIAGAILAFIPLLLHLITRRPPERAPLPTARFLRADPRMAIRIQRRPVDIILLALRMLFVLLVALAFAAPTWTAPRRGTIDFVLLDRGRGMSEAWVAAVDSARRLLAASNAAELIVFDTAAVQRPAALRQDVAFDSLRAAGAAPVEGDYAVALRALLTSARRSRADSARAWLVTRPRWGAWPAGLSQVRAAAWPGAIQLVVAQHSGPAADSATRRSEPGRAVVLTQADTFVVAALEAIGYRVLRGDSARVRAGPGVAQLVLVPSAAMTLATEADALAAARAGATVIVAGPPPPAGLAEAISLRPSTDSVAASAPVTFDDGTELLTLHDAVPVEASTGANVIAAGSNGRVNTIATRIGDGCIVYFAGDLFTRAAGLSVGYVGALRRLVRGCAAAQILANGVGTEGLPLDSAARALLAGAQLPATVPLSSVAAAGGDSRSLMRVLLIAALLVALAETWLAYRGGAVR